LADDKLLVTKYSKEIFPEESRHHATAQTIER